jgi:hypothetical protein
MFTITALAGHAQFDPKKVCRYEDGKLIFTLDQRWTAKQQREISQRYSIDSALMAAALGLKPIPADSCYGWKARKIDANRVELTGEPCNISGGAGTADKIFLLDDQVIQYKKETTAETELFPYGVNRLTRNTIVQLSPGKLRFFLPGYKNAKRVMLCGSFNDWSTAQTPMTHSDSGWLVTLNLQPGKYAYKYIIDGKWVNDLFNKSREDDTQGGYNNVFFCYNYKFALTGFEKAKNVLVAGSFNQWNEKELRMIRFRGNWVLPMFLREGTHAYKFIVDGEWITDPSNKVTRPDGMGHFNSFVGIGDTLFFSLKGYPNAKKVIVSGDFNGWNKEELSMTRTKGGWSIPYVLAAGNYEYKFIVDGEWVTDPANPFTTGVEKVRNSFLAVRPNFTFRLEQHSDARNAIVTGSFNNWSQQDYRMDMYQGTWLFPIWLKPGKYTYKYIVDGKWIQDPTNTLWEENEFGTGNSVVWVER